MQLSQTLLLASILFFLSFAGATPLTSKRSPSGFVSLPVKRFQPETNDLHPLIVSSILHTPKPPYIELFISAGS